MYIQDVAQLKKYVNVNNDFDSQFELITSQETISIPKYFLNWMSQDLITEINGFSTESPTSIKGRAYNLMIGAMCRFTLLEYTYSGELEVGSGGITRHESENTKTAYSGQIKTLRKSLEDNGYLEINALVELMNANASIFTKWATSPGSLLNSKLLIKTSTEFNSAKRLHRPATTFMSLIPDMQINQDMYLSSAFPETLLNELILNDSLSSQKKQVRSDLVFALVHFTIASSIETGLVKLTGEGVQVIEETSDSTSDIAKTAELSRITATVRSLHDTAQRYIDKANKFIQNNPTGFPGVTIEEATTTQTAHTFRV